MAKLSDAVVYSDDSIKYEVNGIIRRLLNVGLVPLLNNLPVKSINTLVKTHQAAKEVVENKTNHYALEILYQRGSTFAAKNIGGNIIRRFWFHNSNARAVRNRLKIVKAELQRDIKVRIDNGDIYIKILNIASGSARAVLETIDSFSQVDGVTFDVTFLDKNPIAVEYSKALAKEFDISKHRLSWVTATVGEYFRQHDHDDSEPFDIVEMVGLMDYFSDKRAIEIFSKIHSRLNSGAFFITANIVPNAEQPFITNVMGWEMIYRYAKDIRRMLLKAGFADSDIRMYYEPLYIHSLASVYK